MTPAEAIREKLQLTVFVDNLFGENCYLLGRRDTAQALVIDPGLQVRSVLSLVERKGIAIERIVVTHGHIDHIAGVPLLQSSLKAPVMMHPEDRAILDFEQFAQLPFVPDGFGPFEIDDELEHGMDIVFQDLRLRVLHTPGHTEGSVCLVAGLDCFSGDTLFERGIGRTDLPGGNMQKIVFSIRNQLYTLPAETLVHPGHGSTTTIRSEMLLNPFVPGFP
jgi:glyoxylase-like metal-dependent hydrolase (beta-lactamase superfamily II)